MLKSNDLLFVWNKFSECAYHAYSSLLSSILMLTISAITRASNQNIKSKNPVGGNNDDHKDNPAFTSMDCLFVTTDFRCSLPDSVIE